MAWHAGRRRTGNHVDSSLNPDVSSGLGNHPYHLGDLPNLSALEGCEDSRYTIHSAPVTKDGLGFHVDPVCPSCYMNFFPTEQL